jgi:hypothetical protein
VKALSVGIFVLLFFSYLATIICYQRIKAFLKANMQTDVVHGVNRKTLNKIIRSMLIQVGYKIDHIKIIYLMFFYFNFNITGICANFPFAAQHLSLFCGNFCQFWGHFPAKILLSVFCFLQLAPNDESSGHTVDN